MKTLIVGLDPSSRKLALVYGFLHGDEGLSSRIYQLPQNVIPALAITYRAVYRFIRSYTRRGYLVVFLIEEPVVGKGGAYATIKQSKVHGAAVAGATAAGALADSVNVSTWKKEVVGKGNADKVAVAQWVRKHWPEMGHIAGPDQDLIDAGCIYRHARATAAHALSREDHTP